jgi:hypothetical protein
MCFSVIRISCFFQIFDMAQKMVRRGGRYKLPKIKQGSKKMLP